MLLTPPIRQKLVPVCCVLMIDCNLVIPALSMPSSRVDQNYSISRQRAHSAAHSAYYARSPHDGRIWGFLRCFTLFYHKLLFDHKASTTLSNRLSTSMLSCLESCSTHLMSELPRASSSSVSCSIEFRCLDACSRAEQYPAGR